LSDKTIIHDRGRGPEIRGTRITVFNIMDHHLAGRSREWIAEFYKLSSAEVQAAQDYIDAHLSDLLPKYERDVDWARKGNSAEVQALFEESHRRLKRRVAEMKGAKAGEVRDARAAG
jgi:uncharacterized protein (DUF433 family)